MFFVPAADPPRHRHCGRPSAPPCGCPADWNNDRSIYMPDGSATGRKEVFFYFRFHNLLILLNKRKKKRNPNKHSSTCMAEKFHPEFYVNVNQARLFSLSCKLSSNFSPIGNILPTKHSQTEKIKPHFFIEAKNRQSSTGRKVKAGGHTSKSRMDRGFLDIAKYRIGVLKREKRMDHCIQNCILRGIIKLVGLLTYPS